MKTVYKTEISSSTLACYLDGMVGRVYKILPLKEADEPTLDQYIESMQLELTGNKELLCPLREDSRYVTLLGIFQYLRNHHGEMDARSVKREVFKAIGLVKQMRGSHALDEERCV